MAKNRTLTILSSTKDTSGYRTSGNFDFTTSCLELQDNETKDINEKIKRAVTVLKTKTTQLKDNFEKVVKDLQTSIQRRPSRA
jgi:hypothetical protein